MDVEAIYSAAAEDKIPLNPQEIYTNIKLEISIKGVFKNAVNKSIFKASDKTMSINFFKCNLTKL